MRIIIFIGSGLHWLLVVTGLVDPTERPTAFGDVRLDAYIRAVAPLAVLAGGLIAVVLIFPVIRLHQCFNIVCEALLRFHGKWERHVKMPGPPNPPRLKWQEPGGKVGGVQ